MIRYIVAGALTGTLAFAAVIASSFIAPAEASRLHPDCNVTMPCASGLEARMGSRREARRTARG